MFAGLITAAVIVGGILFAENSYNGIPLVKYRTVYVSLPTIGHLKQHDPVNIGGVRVGQVLRTSTMNNRALVELQLRGVGALPTDTTAVVRAKGLLGERYVDLKPGGSHDALADGATIREGDGTYTSGVPETLDLFDTDTRTALGKMTRGLGTGLEGRGTQLNQAIHVGPTSGADFDIGADAIVQRDAGAPARNFLPALNGGFTALNASREEFARMLAPAARTLGAIVDERRSVDALLVEMPRWFKTMEGLGTLDQPGPAVQLLGALSHFADVGNDVLPGVPADLRSATQLLQQAAAPLHRAEPLFDEVPRAVPKALDILNDLRPDIPKLGYAFRRLNFPARQLSIRGCDVQSLATGVRSLVNWGTTPGGNYGPNVGFPLTIILGPQEAGNSFDPGFHFPRETTYSKPCEYVPGVEFGQLTLDSLLSGAIPTR
jgi:ABC-type transporter Mla subunit MlaD